MDALLDTHPSIATILADANARGATKGLSYAGEVTATEAWQLVEAGHARIVDVRSEAEFEFVGRVPDSTLIVWKHWPSNALNAQWLDTLRRHAQPDETLLLLCRSGVRSHAAATAAAAAGYSAVYNIIDGFEGPLDAQQRRAFSSGWKVAGLPWVQS